MMNENTSDREFIELIYQTVLLMEKLRPDLYKRLESAPIGNAKWDILEEFVEWALENKHK